MFDRSESAISRVNKLNVGEVQACIVHENSLTIQRNPVTLQVLQSRNHVAVSLYFDVHTRVPAMASLVARAHKRIST